MGFSSITTSSHFAERLWDAFCIASIIGIWPRFIEPHLLCTSHHKIYIPHLDLRMNGMIIVQISDLHMSSYLSDRYLKRILKRIKKIKPDLIVFTGDLLCYSELSDKERLFSFLAELQAPLGCFAIFGNHDYSQYVSLAEDGNARCIQEHISPLLRGFSRLFSTKKDEIDDPIVTKPIDTMPELYDLYHKAGFQVLHNEHEFLSEGGAKVNLIGLGDVMVKQCFPEQAFLKVDPRFPTIVLSHNPDSYPLFQNYPADLVLFGHTHGGQVNLPFIWEKITPLINKQFKSGLISTNGHKLYISRGLGATFPFRWFAPPEISHFTLIRSGPVKEPILSTFFEREKAPENAYGSV